MALGSTQPLTEMSTGYISWGKGRRCVRLTTLPPSCAVVMKSWKLKFLEPSGPLQACNGTALPFYTVDWTGGLYHDVPKYSLKACHYKDGSRSLWVVAVLPQDYNLLQFKQ
jgi:hypothetical protein